MIRIYIILAAIAIIGGYFAYSQMRIESLNQTIAQQAQTLQTQTATIEKLQQDLKTQTQELVSLSKRMSDAEERAKKATLMLRKHDLEKLMKAKPSLVERQLNEATQRVFRQIEADTSNISE
jgi:uncharacterized coiled-coil protein SlyX